MLALAYHLVIVAVLVSLLGILAVNLWVLPRIEHFGPPHVDGPHVVVLVPARNEETNIEACLVSLLAQDYPNFQVWVYDDASTDRTREIAERLAAHTDGRLHVVRGHADPPPGWLGKAHACRQLYAAMLEPTNPDYVLFTDADVTLQPGALGHAVGAARQLDAGLLSIFPMQITCSLPERLAVPLLLHWTVYTFLPLPLAHSQRSGSSFAAANGQFMLFRREAYEAFGGHEAVRSEILEDVVLARATKRAGYRSILADGGDLVRTRMYHGALEVWNGYSKNAYAFFGYSPVFLAIGVLALTALYVTPIAFMLLGAFSGDGLLFGVALVEYLLAVAARLMLSFRFGYSALDAFLHPLAIIYVIAIELNSMRWAITGKSTWKGRSYNSLGR
ncbi:MAG: chlorobactene glucosyltransferase [Chloroflexia bacterium]|jgi:chlorobactene glucosyltransferase|nr:chlorobactene glucosyltransferase [Chloroflexia bacterium]